MNELKGFDSIKVELIGLILPPYELSVASARTCYSGRGIIYPSEVSKDEKAVALRDKIASSTLEAGHITTRQHAHFTFALSGVSRHFIWSFLHSHPFYNSEQVSQRYVRVKPGNFLIPPMDEAQKRIFLETVEFQIQSYESLIGALKPPLSSDFFVRFPARKQKPEAWATSIDKRAFEVARYALGVGTTAYLYHTISALTLLRYSRLCQLFDCPTEQKIVVKKMLDLVLAEDPLFAKEIQDPLPMDQTTEYRMFVQHQADLKDKTSGSFLSEFDSKLEGRVSKLTSATPKADEVLAEAVRVALGKTQAELPSDKAVSLVLDPKENRILGDTLNTSTMDRLSQALHHLHFSFHKKISHTADSQDQRHRMVFASRPVLAFHYTGKPDFIVPFGVTQSPEAQDIYNRSMAKSFEAINQLLDSGLPKEYAFYLLPNAYPIRMISSGDLHSWHHKWKLRSCYNAQEEIFRATVDEVSQVKALYPSVGEHLRAPCYLRLRAGVKPYCPEGDRFCGVPVWKLNVEQYSRKSL